MSVIETSSEDKLSMFNIDTTDKGCSLCTTVEEHLRHVLPKTPKMPASKEKVERDHVYKIEVYTGHEVDSGTNANVYISVKGSESVLDWKKLSHSSHTKTTINFYFMRATKEVFFVRAPNLGNLETIVVQHDGLEERHSWLLDKIDITDTCTEQCWTFSCGQWLTRHLVDHTAKVHLVGRPLELTHSDGVVDLPETEYTISVTTGKKIPAGASVVMTLFGMEGHSRTIDLNEDGSWETKKFNGGQTLTMTDNMPHIGDLIKIRIEHDSNDQQTSGWALVRVVVKCDNKKQYFFQYGGWIGKDTKGKIIRDVKCDKVLPNKVTQEKSDWHFCYLCANMEEHKRNHLHWRPKRPFTAKPRMTFKVPKPKTRKYQEEKPKPEEFTYKVDVYTGSGEDDAGTNANVFVTIKGELDVIDRTKLLKTTFLENSHQTFLIKGPWLGKILMLTIEHDGEDKKDSWYLEKVVVTDTHKNREWVFPCKQWLSNHKQDCRLRRDLIGREKTSPGSSHVRDTRQPMRTTSVLYQRPKTSTGRENRSHKVTQQSINTPNTKDRQPLQTTNITNEQVQKPVLLKPLRQTLEAPVLKPAATPTGVNTNKMQYTMIQQQRGILEQQIQNGNRAIPTFNNQTANSPLRVSINNTPVLSGITPNYKLDAAME